MLTLEGCRARRQRLWERLATKLDLQTLVLTDPIHLRYFANFHVDPFSLGADFGGLLVLFRDGTTLLHHDNRLPKSVESAHVDDRRVVPWYDGLSPGRGPRRLLLHPLLQQHGGRIHDSLADPLGPMLVETIAELRRQKDPDEVAVLRRCMRATEAGHAWACANVRPGMTELEVYAGIAHACTLAADQAAVVYGDFAVSPGSARRGGQPTLQVVRAGDMLILDYSVVLWGYRSDFTNTLVVGAQPTSHQQQLFDWCTAAMRAGEAQLRAGVACLTVENAVRQVFMVAGMDQHFPHHAGHGLGLSHPESPYIVRHATETLLAGDVVTLEPGLYVDGVGGIRIEHNYLITETGFERLSNHTIRLS